MLQLRMIRDCFERGDHTYDLGPGYPQCKRSWQTHVATSYRYTHFPHALGRAQLLRMKRWFRGWFAARKGAKGEGERRTAEAASGPIV